MLGEIDKGFVPPLRSLYHSTGLTASAIDSLDAIRRICKIETGFLDFLCKYLYRKTLPQYRLLLTPAIYNSFFFIGVPATIKFMNFFQFFRKDIFLKPLRDYSTTGISTYIYIFFLLKTRDKVLYN